MVEACVASPERCRCGAMSRRGWSRRCASGRRIAGPIRAGIHRSEGVALGIQRLRIIDLETGDQPIYNEDRSVAVVLNGEIYNFQELRAELERRGHSFYTRTRHRGDRPPLRGARARAGRGAERDVRVRRLGRAPAAAAARPRPGREEAPLLRRGRRLAQLRLGAAGPDGGPGGPAEIDPSSIDCYLAYGYIPAPWSIWRDVRKLRPAHTLVWENGRTTTERYWQLDYSRKRTEDRRELEEELREPARRGRPAPDDLRRPAGRLPLRRRRLLDRGQRDGRGLDRSR